MNALPIIGKNVLQPAGIPQQQNGKSKDQKFDLSSIRITSKTSIPPIEPVITIGESIFAVKGDISFVSGLPKAGKSAIAVFMIATALVPDFPHDIDTLQIRSTFCQNKPVVYIDTEQPKGYTKKLLDTVLKLIGVMECPEWLHIYNLREYDRKEKLRCIKQMMEEMPDAHMWTLDGVGDVVNDPNDASESFPILDYFSKIAQQNNTTIVLYLHENPGNNKMRGNLGSEAERKCGATITVKKDRASKIHSIAAKLIRGSDDFADIFFRYDTELGRMVSLGVEETKNMKTTLNKDMNKRQKLVDIAWKCFSWGAEKMLTYNELVNRIILYESPTIKNRTAKTRVKEMQEEEIIIKNDQSEYHLVDTEKIQKVPDREVEKS